jgi:hypothetical protein
LGERHRVLHEINHGAILALLLPNGQRLSCRRESAPGGTSGQ